MEKNKIKLLNDLLNDIAQGDDESVLRLYDIIGPYIRFIALKYIRNKNDADDLVQDFWADISKYAANFRFRKNAFGYLFKVMTRLALNRYKKLNNHVTYKIDVVDYFLVDDNKLDDGLEIAKLRNDIHTAMSKLNKNQQIIIQATFFEDKTAGQIAKDIDLSKSHVYRLKHEAIEIMKSELTEKGWDKYEL